MNKRGISTIVATVLIVLVTVASVSILWVAALPLIQQVAFIEDPNVQVKIQPGEYTAYDEAHNLISIRVTRGADDSNIKALKFVLEEEGNTRQYITEDVLLPNSGKVYQFGVDYFGFIDGIKVVPIYDVNGVERESEISSEFSQLPEKDLLLVALNPVPFHDSYPSCKAIFDAGLSQGDDYYIIDPDGPGGEPAVITFCDMTDGGWTRIDYLSDLVHGRQFVGINPIDLDASRWLPNNFSLRMPKEQILALQSISTEGKQIYNGSCNGIIHYYYQHDDNYIYSFGFRYANDDQSLAQVQDYGPNITVLHDNCYGNHNSQLHYTAFEIIDLRVPITNVYSRDNGNVGEFMGARLTQYPAWLR